MNPKDLKKDILKFHLLKFEQMGYLGEHNRPRFEAETFLFQSLFHIAQFHHCLN